MQKISSDKKKTLIVGMGETGLSAARFLKCRNIPFAAIDSRAQPPRYRDFLALLPASEVHVGEFSERHFLAAHNIILSPGVALTTPQVQDAVNAGVPVCSDVELFARYVHAEKPVVAITGTNGKSTVTALVSEMARQGGLAVATGGNYGTPALDLISTDQVADIYVLELSSFQLETTYSLKPSVSVILNISEDHLDRYESYSDYVHVKQRVHYHSRCAVVNRESNFEIPIDSELPTISFGMDIAHGDNFGVMRSAGKMYIAQGDEKWIACNELSCLSGIGGILNAQAALAIGSAVGISKSAMLSALRRFTGLPHRFQSVGILAGVEWINDSKATNVAATIMALNSLNRPCIWIAGGDGKGADFSVLNSVVENKVSAAFLFGKDKQEIAAALHNSHIQLNLVDDLSAAMREARRYAHDGDCVLLSPACASLDMYTNYIERGNHFVEIFRGFSDA